jgi:ferredoxin
MITLKINNTTIYVKEGSTLLDAALHLGLEIPTMCHNGDLEHFTSCMVCMVKDAKTGKLLPSCTARALEGMEIVTDDNEIMESRKIALELLLSEHAGDCEAPCRVSCPAFMDIPLMNRLIVAGQYQQALEVVMRDIALPGVMGRICPAPCEGACKRKPIDDGVSICLLKRFTADETSDYPTPVKKTPTGHKVAIIGAGPAGLSAAYYLQIRGIQPEVFDNHDLPGGALQYSIPELDKEVLKKEADFILEQGAKFHPNTFIDKTGFEKLRSEFDAVIVATGNYTTAMDDWGLENNGKQVTVVKGSYLTSMEGVFAIGNVNRPVKLAIRSAAQGKEVAKSVAQLLAGEPVRGEERWFNSTLGKLMAEEHSEYLKEGTHDERQSPGEDPKKGFDVLLAQKEAARCLHCDCRKPDNCKLRSFAQEYSVSKKRFAYTDRKPVKKYFQQDVIISEPGKCIKCGICVRITAKHQERFGFTFIGRGFDVLIGVPFDQDLETALEKTALLVADACPTGALCRLGEQLG